MSRHRNVRGMNYEDEYYDEDEVYGHSVEDDYCISPGTAAQFTYSRHVDLSSFMDEKPIPEEEEEEDENDHDSLNSSHGQKSILNDIDQAKMNSCLEEMRNVLGETCSERVLQDAILKHNFNLEASLNEILSTGEASKPQRLPKESRRNRAQAFAPNPPTVQLKAPSEFKKQPVKDNAKKDKQSAVIPSEVNLSSNERDSKQKQIVTKDNKPNASIVNSNKSLVLNCDKNSDNSSDKMGDTSQTFARDGATAALASNSDVLDGGMLAEDKSCDVAVKTLSISDAKPKLSTPAKTYSRSRPDPEKLQVDYEKRQGGKDLLNLIVIGHVDAGKSTLMGHLLYQLGVVNKRAMHKYETESKKAGKGSFAFAWVLDETEEERSRGVTMDIAQVRFETPKKTITLLDAPGHKDFIPNMITGTAQADVGILVVNAARGEFETGFESGGQTREHGLLARSLGVGQLIIAINKMDSVGWSQERYDDISKKIGQFLKAIGYKDSDLSFVPCSGLSGENLTKSVTEPRLSSWYRGHTLAEQIDSFSSVTRHFDKSFRMCVGDVYKGMGAGFSITGKIGSGFISAGDRVMMMPSGDLTTVKGISIGELSSPCAYAGDHVTLTLTGMDMEHVSVGCMLCEPSDPARSAIRIRAKIVIFQLERPITKGYTVVFHYQSINVPAIIVKLKSQLNKSTGEVLKTNPKCLLKNSSAVVELEFERPVCLEVYKEYRDLGRFMLRLGGHTIAAGLVEEVLKVKSKMEETSSSAVSSTAASTL